MCMYVQRLAREEFWLGAAATLGAPYMRIRWNLFESQRCKGDGIRRALGRFGGIRRWGGLLTARLY